METQQKAEEITDYFVGYLNKGEKPGNYDELVQEVQFMLETD